MLNSLTTCEWNGIQRLMSSMCNQDAHGFPNFLLVVRKTGHVHSGFVWDQNDWHCSRFPLLIQPVNELMDRFLLSFLFLWLRGLPLVVQLIQKLSGQSMQLCFCSPDTTATSEYKSTLWSDLSCNWQWIGILRWPIFLLLYMKCDQVSSTKDGAGGPRHWPQSFQVDCIPSDILQFRCSTAEADLRNTPLLKPIMKSDCQIHSIRVLKPDCEQDSAHESQGPHHAVVQPMSKVRRSSAANSLRRSSEFRCDKKTKQKIQPWTTINDLSSFNFWSVNSAPHWSSLRRTPQSCK